jgi:hypothetical protein
LELTVESSAFREYRAALQRLERPEDLLIQNGLIAARSNGSVTVPWVIPGSTLEDGHAYVVTLYGIDDTGAAKSSRSFGFLVRKK